MESVQDQQHDTVPSTQPEFPRALMVRLESLLAGIYPDHDSAKLAVRIATAFWSDGQTPLREARTPDEPLWDETDCYVITYGNTFEDGTFKPLDLLHDFLLSRLEGVVSGVHILPYFPFTSDDGFAVTDHCEVNSSLGDWADIERIASRFRLMSDIVINHGSSQSKWFAAYRQGHAPYDRFFFEEKPETDLSAVVRPRAHPLLREVQTANGTRHVWCTFSHDQADFDFRNPDVLTEFVRIFRFHIAKGVRTFRLDAVAFLWKVAGTSCIHLPQTHLVVKLFRLLADHAREPVILITETNVPSFENLSYFGERDEAHLVYNFPLPPLLLHALLNGTSRFLNAWKRQSPDLPAGCSYFNFTASHDGIGMRPAEGLLPEEDIARMIDTVAGFGGMVSFRQGNDGQLHPYELNVALFDAMMGTVEGADKWQVERFICSQTIAMGLKGIPAFYIHSLLASPNDHEGLEKMGYNRAINRKRWNFPEISELLEDTGSRHHRVFTELTRLIALRCKQPAFHPDGEQKLLEPGDAAFAFLRRSPDGEQTIIALHNLTRKPVSVSLSGAGTDEQPAFDVISGKPVTTAEETVELAPYQCCWIDVSGSRN